MYSLVLIYGLRQDMHCMFIRGRGLIIPVPPSSLQHILAKGHGSTFHSKGKMSTLNLGLGVGVKVE